jgi:hypothetical protein
MNHYIAGKARSYRYAKSLAFVVGLTVCLLSGTAAQAASSEIGAARVTPAPSEVSAMAKGDKGAEPARRCTALASLIDSECLKEGESCNIIVNRCCPGLSCQGGVTAVCTRKTERKQP